MFSRIVLHKYGMRKHDLTGQQFTKLTVNGLSDKKKHKQFLWECTCECGTKVYCVTQLLMSGKKKSCGCTKHNLIGYRTGNLTVIKEAGFRRFDKTHSERLWLCKCDCGQETTLPTAVLTKNITKTCGCAQKRTGNDNPLWKGHGEISAVMWNQIEGSAISRNLELNISIEQLWDLFLEQNRECALSKLPIEFGESSAKRSETTASLDRIDSNKGYTLDNVQWVHKEVNKMKTDLRQDRFLELCKLIAKNRKK